MTDASLGRPIGPRLVVASHNAGKIFEIRMLIAPYAIEAVSAGELGIEEPEETGVSFVANARLKALNAARASGLPALADDSGMAADALGGAPGIFTARWAGPGRDFAIGMERVETALQAVGATSPEARRGRFVAALCLAFPDGAVHDFVGIVEGTLVWPPRGELGFGYDPMFQPDGHARTFGEMTGEEKHGLDHGPPLSHRARAFTLFARACLGDEG